MSKPLVIAHRGARYRAPENTLPAFEEAILMGVNGLEIDVRLTQDKVPVISHDDHLIHHAQVDRRISKITLNELKCIDIGAPFSEKFRGTRIPLLEEVCALIKDDLLLNIEIKSENTWNRGIEKCVIDVLRAFHFSQNILISSFNPQVLWKIRRLAPELKTGLLFHQTQSWFGRNGIASYLMNVDAMNPFIGLLDAAAVTRWRHRGKRIFTWTVNRDDDMDKAIALGVDGIITDEPEKLISKLQNFHDASIPSEN